MLGKLSEKNKTLDYNVKATYFSDLEGAIVGMNALDPKLITYNRTNVQKENWQGTGKETVLPHLALDLPDWQELPKYGWMKGFKPSVVSSKEAQGRWYCRFSQVRGLSAKKDQLAVCYSTAKFAKFENGQCIGKKIGVAVFRKGEGTPFAHRWLGEGLLVGTYNDGFVLFWPNQGDDGTLRPTVEIWYP